MSTLLTGPLTGKAACDSYEPGHRLHWSLYKAASAARTVKVRALSVDGTTVSVTTVTDETFTWEHHDPEALTMAINHADTTPLVAPDWRALRIDGYWFNCAPEGVDVSACG